MAETLKIPIEFTFNENGLNEALHFVADLQKKYDDLENESERLCELVFNLEKGVVPSQMQYNNPALLTVAKYLINPTKE